MSCHGLSARPDSGPALESQCSTKTQLIVIKYTFRSTIQYLVKTKHRKRETSHVLDSIRRCVMPSPNSGHELPVLSTIVCLSVVRHIAKARDVCSLWCAPIVMTAPGLRRHRYKQDLDQSVRADEKSRGDQPFGNQHEHTMTAPVNSVS